MKSNRKTGGGSKEGLKDRALEEMRKGTSLKALRDKYNPSAIYSAFNVFMPEAERLASEAQDRLKSLRSQVIEVEREKTGLDTEIMGFTAQRENVSNQLAKSEEKLQATSGELGKAGRQLTGVKKEIADSEKQRDEALQNNETTIYDAGWFRKASERLITKGLDIHDLDKVEPLLENIKKLEGDPWKVLDFYTRSVDLENRSGGLRVQVAEYESKLTNVKEELKDKENQLEEKAEMEAAIKKLEARGLFPGHMDVIAEKIIQISKRHGLGAKEAVDKFAGDIATQYDEKLGFEVERNLEKTRRDQLAQEISALKEDKRTLGVEYSAKEDAVKALQDLNGRGVANSDVVMWLNILDGQRDDLGSFKKKMDELGGLKGYLESKQKTVKSLEAQESMLTTNISSQKEALKLLNDLFLTKNKEYTDVFVEGVKKLNNALRVLDESFNSPETGLKKRTEGLVASTLSDISRVSSNVRVASTRQLEEVNKKIKEVVDTVEKVKESSFRAGEVMGKYSSLKPLLSLYAGENVDPDQVQVSTIAVLDALSIWLHRQGNSQSGYSCDQFRATLRREWLNVSR